jgi:hypothetical protein
MPNQNERISFPSDSSPSRRNPNSISPCDRRITGSGWGNPKGGDILGILTKEEIDAFNENPKKGVSKGCLTAYVISRNGTDGVRYKAAGEPLDLDKLKVLEDEDEEMEDEAEEEEEEDAALEDVRDLYDEDEEGKGKKRKRAAADDGEEEKPGRKKV